MSTIQEFEEAAAKATQASAQADTWANGAEGVYVETDSGPVPTIAEFARANQERADNAIANFNPQTRELLRRSYAEAGYNLVDGSFESGAIVSTIADVCLFEADGQAYSWGGTLPKTVPINSTPSNSGGLGPSAWKDQSETYSNANIKHFGAVGDGVTDDAPAFRAAAAYAKANGPLTVYVPKGNYRFIVADVIPSISSGCCVPMDGVSDLQIIGRAGANILIEAAPARVNAFTHYVSAESATAQQWSQRNTIKGLTFKYTRAVGFAGAFTGILMLGCEDSEVSNNKFDYTAALGGNFGTNGSGKNNKYLNNVFKGVATCFDMSHCEDCTFEGNRCIGSSNAVGAFAHFYDLNTVDDIRMETPFSQAISSGNLFTGNAVQGYPSAFSLRGIRDSWVVDNRIHSFQANDTTTRNMISLYTENKEFNLVPSQHTRGIIVSRNVIYGVNNTGGGQTRGIFINQFGGTYPVSDVTISHNIIHDMPNGVGISYDHTPRNWSVFGNVIDAETVGTPYGREGIALAVPSSAGISPEINVTGDVDLILRPGPTRFVRFGTTTPNSDAPVTGYITIRDLAGVARKLAVIS